MKNALPMTLMLAASTAMPALTYGVSFDNPYAGVDWSTFGQHKGNLHNHTTQSDGAETPAERIDEYASRGYGILALTDHNTTTWSWNDYGRNPADLGMIAIQGCEPSRHDHILSLFNGYNGSSNNIDTSFQTIGANGGLSIIAHPGRYNRSTQWYVDHYNNYDHLIGMEVYNQGDRYSGDRAKWDAILTETVPNDRFVWGFSNDDTHRTSHVGRNTNFFLLPELTETAVRNAMVEGHSYFSYSPVQDGAVPTIGSIDVDDAAGTISIAGDGYSEIRWISEGAHVASGATFDYNAVMAGSGDSYVRAELHGPTGITYTQPFGVDDDSAPIEEPPSPFVEYTFEQGVAGYAGTTDTMIRSSAPGSSYGSVDHISVDGDDGSPGLQPNHGLIKFDNIVGDNEGQIPAGTVIESATVTLDVHNPGSGFEVFAMTTEWSDATTWNDLNGITPGTNAENEAITKVGANNGSSNVGTGLLDLDVTTAAQAWADGETNNGLGLKPFTNGTNGIDFDTSEGADAPVLTIKALREGVIAATFQEGEEAYDGTEDTYLAESEPTTSHATVASMSIDNNDPHGTGNDNHGLLMFDNIFGDEAGQIPTDETTRILLAELILTGTNPGTGANLHRMLQAWSDDATWAGDFGGDGIQNDGVEAVAVADAFTSGMTGTVTIEVTKSLEAWLADPTSNFGWLFSPIGGDGWDFDTSEGANAPMLRVYYDAVPEPASLALLGLGGLMMLRRGH
ncbi:DNRLRE domain-containing protein [Mucisphaera calidilacus]|uniref:PHP domain protein n=1 Tax=Mucisphaera calidilacus TaxID=2527982 RepID=A0A518BVM2_9BACT|nr:DNRLRE domain-containing protein [Mucisphaera calidilacus]QDU70997.1 PHP domain protein [Mucisphaera calidilacus]